MPHAYGSQLSDLDFILEHLDDVNTVFALKNGEITILQQGRDQPENQIASDRLD